MRGRRDRISAPSAARPFLVAVVLGALLISSAFGKKTVVIDAGHGGADNGTRWGGVEEKRLALDMAKRVEAMLRQKNIPTAMTRTADTTVTLDERVAIANKFDDVIFVSLHFNASRDTSIRGTETYYMSAEGKTLASIIQARLGKRILTRNRGIKRRTDLAVLHKTKGVAALVECGFISNKWERDRCDSPWLRNILAEEITAGIVAYYNR